ncbi:MAG: F0F1 ATP synthase subunit A [Anaerolineae bacterium]|nr:F0F1 ATP synthase subunit A [Anaerolineae bacterium]
MGLEEELIPVVYLQLGPLQITSTVVNTWIIMAIVCGVLILMGRRMRVKPTRWQNALEWIVEAVDGLIRNMIPEEPRLFLPVVGTLAVFITASNLGGLIPGLKSPTTDINTPLALAIVVFFSVHYYGIWRKGVLGHLKHYVEPIFILLPIEIASELARTLSLTFRLFGNILGEEIVIAVLFLILPYFIPVPMMLFSIFTSVIQAYVFAMLTVVYIAGAVEAHK